MCKTDKVCLLLQLFYSKPIMCEGFVYQLFWSENQKFVVSGDSAHRTLTSCISCVEQIKLNIHLNLDKDSGI